MKEQFEIREKHMLNLIKGYEKKHKKIVVQIGDTHLRTISTSELGEPSPIYLEFKDREDILIIRSKTGEIE